MSEFTPLLRASPSPPPNIPAFLPPIFSDLEAQATYFRALEKSEAERLRRIRLRPIINKVIVAAAVGIGILMIGLLVYFGGNVDHYD